MKYLFLLSLLGITFSLQSQLLNPYEDWFEMESFFNEDEIKHRGIRSIRLNIRDKKDGRIFSDQQTFIQYYFRKDGQLEKTLKTHLLSSKIDTSLLKLTYDEAGHLIHKVEINGPFHFEYHYGYQDQYLFKSIKINPRLKDTLYVRYHEFEVKENQLIELVENRHRNPFLKNIYHFDDKGNLLHEKNVFLFNKNEINQSYRRENGKVIGMHYQKEFGHQRDILWKFNYRLDQLKSVEIYEKGHDNEKLAFTYEKGLPTSIIRRNERERNLRWYELSYQYW